MGEGVLFFFFQAEDGIRDFHVTGVQTCALPISAIPGLELVELDSDTCCGSAGVHNLLEPESAREIGERKVDSVLAAAPDLLVSANPGCTLQIQMLLRERGRDVRTAHPIEVLDASIRGVRP